MGYVYHRVMKYINKNNQDDILDYIGYLANIGLNKYKIVDEIKNNFDNKNQVRG